MTKPTSLAVVLALSVAAFGFSPDAKRPTPKPAATPAATEAAATNSCTACKERRPTLDPARFAKLPEREVQAGYEIARKIPATLDRIHCFCECAESPMFRHKTLLTCFTDTHAAGCGICLSEARLAYDLKSRGLSDDEIVNTVESVHKTEGHPATH
jgi:alkylhydroperoxidase family enzyme